MASHSAEKSRTDKRKRIKSHRVSENDKNNQAAQAARQSKKAKKAERVKAKKKAAEKDMIVEKPGDSEEVRQLKQRVFRAEATIDTMHRDNQEAARASAPQSGVADESIPKPRRKSEITIAQIRRHMELGGSQHDREWLNIRNSVRDSVGAAHFNWDYTWKDQKSTKISNALADVEKNIPEFRRFELSWGALYVIQGFFSGHSSYENTKDNTATYNGRRRMRRQQQCAAAHSPPPNTDDATNQRGAGPSHTSRRTPDGGDDNNGAAAASSIGVEAAGRLPRLPGDESSESESESSSASSSDSESGSDT